MQFMTSDLLFKLELAWLRKYFNKIKYLETIRKLNWISWEWVWLLLRCWQNARTKVYDPHDLSFISLGNFFPKGKIISQIMRHFVRSVMDLEVKTHYSAESLSWYSRDRLKQLWTPESFHNLFMMAANSGERSPSSALPVMENSFLASSCK